MGKMGSGGDKTAEMSSCVYVKTEEQIQRQAKHGQKIIDFKKSYTACSLIEELEATVTELYVHIYIKKKEITAQVIPRLQKHEEKHCHHHNI